MSGDIRFIPVLSRDVTMMSARYTSDVRWCDDTGQRYPLGEHCLCACVLFVRSSGIPHTVVILFASINVRSRTTTGNTTDEADVFWTMAAC